MLPRLFSILFCLMHIASMSWFLSDLSSSDSLFQSFLYYKVFLEFLSVFQPPIRDCFCLPVILSSCPQPLKWVYSFCIDFSAFVCCVALWLFCVIVLYPLVCFIVSFWVTKHPFHYFLSAVVVNFFQFLHLISLRF